MMTEIYLIVGLFILAIILVGTGIMMRKSTTATGKTSRPRYDGGGNFGGSDGSVGGDGGGDGGSGDGGGG